MKVEIGIEIDFSGNKLQKLRGKINMGYDIKDKVILITGANRGIGKAMVDTFVDCGVAKIYTTVRKIDSVDFLVEKYGDKIKKIKYLN